MAKDNDLDGFLSDLDKLDDFGTKDNQTISKPSSKREAVSSTLKNTASSVLDGIKQPPLDLAKTAISAALPNDVNAKISDFSFMASNVKDEVTKALDPLRRETASLLDSVNKKVDQNGKLGKIFSSILGKLKGIEDTQSQYVDKEAERTAAITAAIQESLGASSDKDAKEKALLQRIEATRFQSTAEINTRQLAALISIKNFNNTVADQYFRKSLELQFRQYYAAKEMNALMTVGLDTIKQQLEAITKNTSLPDLIKLRGSELLGETFKSRVRNNIADTLFSVASPLQALQKRLISTGKNYISNATDALSSINNMSDMMSMVDDETLAMMGKTRQQFMIESMASSLPKALLTKLFKSNGNSRVLNNPMLNKLYQGFNEASADWKGFINNQANLKEGKGISGKGLNLLRSLTNTFSTDTLNTSVLAKDSIGEPVPFDSLARTSLVKIIPGYLAKIHNEIRATRTGTKPRAGDELVWDNKKQTFGTVSNIVANAKAEYSAKVQSNSAWALDTIIGILESSGKIVFEDRAKEVFKQVLFENIVKRKASGVTFLTSAALQKGLLEKGIGKGVFNGIVKAYNLIKANAKDDYYTYDRLASSFSSLKRGLPNMTATASSYHAMGRSDISTRLTGATFNQWTGNYDIGSQALENMAISAYNARPTNLSKRRSEYLANRRNNRLDPNASFKERMRHANAEAFGSDVLGDFSAFTSELGSAINRQASKARKAFTKENITNQVNKLKQEVDKAIEQGKELTPNECIALVKRYGGNKLDRLKQTELARELMKEYTARKNSFYNKVGYVKGKSGNIKEFLSGKFNLFKGKLTSLIGNDRLSSITGRLSDLKANARSRVDKLLASQVIQKLENDAKNLYDVSKSKIEIVGASIEELANTPIGELVDEGKVVLRDEADNLVTTAKVGIDKLSSKENRQAILNSFRSRAKEMSNSSRSKIRAFNTAINTAMSNKAIEDEKERVINNIKNDAVNEILSVEKAKSAVLNKVKKIFTTKKLTKEEYAALRAEFVESAEYKTKQVTDFDEWLRLQGYNPANGSNKPMLYQILDYTHKLDKKIAWFLLKKPYQFAKLTIGSLFKLPAVAKFGFKILGGIANPILYTLNSMGIDVLKAPASLLSKLRGNSGTSSKSNGFLSNMLSFFSPKKKEASFNDKDGDGIRDGSEKREHKKVVNPGGAGFWSKVKDAGGGIFSKIAGAARWIPLLLGGIALLFNDKTRGIVGSIVSGIGHALASVADYLLGKLGSLLTLDNAKKALGGVTDFAKSSPGAATIVGLGAAYLGRKAYKLGKGIFNVGRGIFNAGKGIFSVGKKVLNVAKGLGGAGKIAAKVATTAAPAAANAVKTGGGIWATAKRIYNNIGKFKDLFVKQAMKRGGQKAMTTFLGKIASKLIPGVGWAMLAWDCAAAAKYMIWDDLPWYRALCKSFIGIDLWDDKEPMVDEETGETIPDVKEEDKKEPSVAQEAKALTDMGPKKTKTITPMWGKPYEVPIEDESSKNAGSNNEIKLSPHEILLRSLSVQQAILKSVVAIESTVAGTVGGSPGRVTFQDITNGLSRAKDWVIDKVGGFTNKIGNTFSNIKTSIANKFNSPTPVADYQTKQQQAFTDKIYSNSKDKLKKELDNLTEGQLQVLYTAYQVGSTKGIGPILAAIAWKESGFGKAVSNPGDGKKGSYGAFQAQLYYARSFMPPEYKNADDTTVRNSLIMDVGLAARTALNWLMAAGKSLFQNGPIKTIQDCFTMVRKYNGKGPAAEMYAADVLARAAIIQDFISKRPMPKLENLNLGEPSDTEADNYTNAPTGGLSGSSNIGGSFSSIGNGGYAPANNMDFGGSSVGRTAQTINNTIYSGGNANVGSAIANVSNTDLSKYGSYFNFQSSAAARGFEGLHPEFKKRLIAMAQEVNEKMNGKKILLTSTWRSIEEQAALKQKYGSRAAQPGGSKHNYGIAIDMNSKDDVYKYIMDNHLLEKYGLHHTVAGEPWHIEPTFTSGIRNTLTADYAKKNNVNGQNYLEHVNKLLGGKGGVPSNDPITAVTETEGGDTGKANFDNGMGTTSAQQTEYQQAGPTRAAATRLADTSQTPVPSVASTTPDLSVMQKADQTVTQTAVQTGGVASEDSVKELVNISGILGKSLEAQLRIAAAVEKLANMDNKEQDKKDTSKSNLTGAKNNTDYNSISKQVNTVSQPAINLSSKAG